jgi:hypothetical protein
VQNDKGSHHLIKGFSIIPKKKCGPMIWEGYNVVISKQILNIKYSKIFFFIFKNIALCRKFVQQLTNPFAVHLEPSTIQMKKLSCFYDGEGLFSKASPIFQMLAPSSYHLQN